MTTGKFNEAKSLQRVIDDYDIQIKILKNVLSDIPNQKVSVTVKGKGPFYPKLYHLSINSSIIKSEIESQIKDLEQDQLIYKNKFDQL